jgi:hypothetical protein
VTRLALIAVLTVAASPPWALHHGFIRVVDRRDYGSLGGAR